MENSRGKKLALNSITSLLLQLITVICGFILPRLILGSFGTDVNGLVNSVTQYLGVITLLDLGVGSVVQSSLYKPLADNDVDSISKIYVSANRFFKRIALILICYIGVLNFFYPLLVNKKFGYIYTVTLIIAIGINSFSQYYFGIVNSLLLNADQKGYVQYTAQIIVLIVNTVVGSVLIKLGVSIQCVKLSTSLIFLFRPLYLMFYVNSHYSINKKIKYTEEPIKQKWNGMAQHFASFILSGTDNIILTLFSSLENVSIYSVYNIVILGVKNTFLTMTNGFQSLLGEMLTKKENEKLNRFFGYVEWFIHSGTTLFFGCTGVLILSFVKVYTNGIDDANYIRPLFSVLIVLANAGHCLRLPYNILILSAGHYKQTQINYIIAMLLNIIISILTVRYWGLIGVAIGTLVSMLYQTVWMAWYDSRNIINWPFKNFVKQVCVDIFILIIASLATFKIPMISISYYAFFIRAVEVFVCWIIIAFVVNFIFYHDRITALYIKLNNKLRHLNIERK